MRLLVLATLSLTMACGDKDAGADDTGGGSTSTSEGISDGGSGDGGSGDGGTSATVNPEAPVVTHVDAFCYLHSTGEEEYIWQVDSAFTDPQGIDTAASFFDGITVYDGSTMLATYTLVCDDEGTCFGSFQESDDNIRCSLASAYTVAVRVLDEDDNWSAPLSTAGRLCPSSEPC